MEECGVVVIAPFRTPPTARAPVQMRAAPPQRESMAADCGRKTHCGKGEWGCHCRTWPRGTPWISDAELRWSTISSFSHQNNKSQPFDTPHPPTHLKQTPDWSFALLLLPWHSVSHGLKVPPKKLVWEPRCLQVGKGKKKLQHSLECPLMEQQKWNQSWSTVSKKLKNVEKK